MCMPCAKLSKAAMRFYVMINLFSFHFVVFFMFVFSPLLQIKCAHVLYKKTRKSTMSFPQVAEAALENGPIGLRKWSNAFRYDWSIIYLYF